MSKVGLAFSISILSSCASPYFKEQGFDGGRPQPFDIALIARIFAAIKPNGDSTVHHTELKKYE